MLRKKRARFLVLTLSSSLALAGPAAAEDTEPAVVVNGTFSSPTVPDGKSWAAWIDGWSGAGVGSAARVKHPRGYQAASLGWDGTNVALSSRLRGVRAGATVTLSWDDGPGDCAAKGSGRLGYTVTVAGTSNPAGSFSTTEATGAASWFTGRTYSFTAAEDAPQVTFDSTVAKVPNCGPMIANVMAKQTAPPLSTPAKPGDNDPCAGEAAGSPACKDVAGGKERIDACPPTSRECLGSVAGDGKAEKDGIAKETQAVADFGKVARDEPPNAAANELCALPNALTASVGPGDAVVPPSEWWFC
ncbi:hypothetical protein ACIRBX_04610 [Kitasatospora sp. NPDC096147]|uniref:hypothetical protein n=1 Tax=Kitasatospora sp. NPDC096147 TaxID=3364093 RepID=UPI00382F002F